MFNFFSGWSWGYIAHAPILLLDEATNALDYETEKKIYNNLLMISHEKIIIVGRDNEA